MLGKGQVSLIVPGIRVYVFIFSPPWELDICWYFRIYIMFLYKHHKNSNYLVYSILVIHIYIYFFPECLFLVQLDIQTIHSLNRTAHLSGFLHCIKKVRFFSLA